MNNRIFTIFLYILLALSALSGQAQVIVVSGQVLDEGTKEGIPFATVVLVGTSQGVTTDENGRYTLELESPLRGDSLEAGSLGYAPLRRALNKTENNQTIVFRLEEASYSVGTVEILAGENPSHEIMRQIVRHKPNNNRDLFETFRLEQYSKMELDLDDIDQELRDRPLFKKFQFIFDNVDSLSDEKPFLPAYLAERIYDVYHVRGMERREVLRAQQVSGVRNQSVVDFINGIQENYNIYDNWIALLEKDFVSPFSDQWKAYYEYYIMDSTFIKGRWCYKLKFKPRRVQEPTFYGDFWVDMEDYAVVMANMRMSPDVNINFVERILLYYESDRDEARKAWLPAREKTVVDFKGRRPETQQEISIIARKTLCYRNYKIDQPDIRDLYKKNDPQDVRPEELHRDTAFWNANRFEQLSNTEAGVYTMIDSIQQVPVYKFFANVITTLATGFVVLGPVEIGEYWNLLTFNEVEQLRIGMGIGTSTKWLGKNNPFSKKIRFYGYAGYGLRDRRWKYYGLFEYVFNKYRRKELGVEYLTQVDFEYRSSEELSSQSLLSGMFRREAPQKLLFQREFKAYYFHTWKHNISNRLVLMHRHVAPYPHGQSFGGGFNYRYLPDPSDPTRIDSTLTTAEVLFSMRFAYKERILTGNFSDVRVGGTRYPAVELRYVAGIRGILGSQHNYHKLALSVKQWFPVRPLGWIEYQVEMGKVFGRGLPYLLLEVHPGNEGYFYNQYAFNAMNNFEFVSDTYISFGMEHHLDGFFLNRIPLLRKLKWREVVALRGVWGKLSPSNQAANVLNNYDRNYRSFNPNHPEGPFYGGFDRGPYLECSVGIENIFRFFRVDALWRLTYLRNRYAQNFSVRMTLDFNF